MATEILRRDELGRPIAEDGYPSGGLAGVSEIARACSLSPGLIYKMINSGELEARRFGRAMRVPWQAVRDAGLI